MRMISISVPLFEKNRRLFESTHYTVMSLLSRSSRLWLLSSLAPLWYGFHLYTVIPKPLLIFLITQQLNGKQKKRRKKWERKNYNWSYERKSSKRKQGTLRSTKTAWNVISLVVCVGEIIYCDENILMGNNLICFHLLLNRSTFSASFISTQRCFVLGKWNK